MSFHQRFNIALPTNEIEQRFINRINILIMDRIIDKISVSASFEKIEKNVAVILGQEFREEYSLKGYYENDYKKCLQTLEILYSSLVVQGRNRIAKSIAHTVKTVLTISEMDLGIGWKNGKFIPKGVEMLDKELVNKSLDWLDKKKYKTVYSPFSLGLKHFLESEKQHDLLKNVIRDMYEALEALSKIITGRESKDLSANRDLFISKINASNEYKEILKSYIIYANNYRHAESLEKVRPDLKPNEVESFMYLTGLFIRLSIK